MTNRREFIQAGVATSALALPGVRSWAGALGAVGLPLYKVVYDQRRPAAALFGAEVRRLGAQAQGVEGEVHDFWYQDVYFRWRDMRAPIAGMTSYNSMFVLAMLAQDVGMRVVYRAHHRPGADGVTTHEVFGPREVQRNQLALRGTEQHWPRTAAAQLLGFPSDALSVARARSNIGSANERLIAPDALVSWIIARPARA